MKCISLFKRLLVLLYEGFLLLAIYFITGGPVAVIFNIKRNFDTPLLKQPDYLALLLFVLGVFYLYFWFCWIRGGQTLAMKAWRCKVVNDAGDNISHQQALIRYSSAIISLLFFGAGFLIALFRKDNATLHDLVSKSYLVKLPK